MRHVLDLSSRAGKLSVENRLLVIECEGVERVTVPLAEIGAVLLAHPRLVCTQAVLAELSAAGASVIACDQRHLPIGMMMPLYGYHAPARRMIAQAEASKPVCKRLWQQLVRAKIQGQAAVLAEYTGSDGGLMAMAEAVRSGDTDNLEGQAARIYWTKLFGSGFRRDFEAEDHNRYLNYGYAVMRAIVCRGLVAAGLHPGLGVHHHHRENPFCLADDLMEPLRPVVDRNVMEFVRLHGSDAPMDKLTKGHLLQVASARCLIDGERREVFEVAETMASTAGQVFEGVREEMVVPDVVASRKEKAA